MTSAMKSGFTLIELLIVVAIISILAAIAIPNYMEAQVRAKVARAQSDMRTLAIALDTYNVDHNGYTMDQDNNPFDARRQGFNRLTTPVAYITTLADDPFASKFNASNPNDQNTAAHYTLASGADADKDYPNDPKHPRVQCYALDSMGPDHLDSAKGAHQFPYSNADFGTYDPTNGTASHGDILRFGGAYRAGNWTLNKIPYMQCKTGTTFP